MKNEIVEVQGNPSDAVRYALKQEGVTVDQLEKLLVIQERYESNQARKEYHSAMSSFKENPPKIDKDKSVSFGAGKAAYKHASLYNVTQKVSEALSKHGLSASWSTKQNGTIAVTCKITHVKGHSEETTLSAPSDVSGNKNPIQAIGSTVTYLERYTLLALCGLATFDADDDAQSVSEFISDSQLGQLRDLVNAKEANEAKFCEYLKVESLEKLPAKDFTKAVAAINAKKK